MKYIFSGTGVEEKYFDMRQKWLFLPGFGR